MDDWEIGVRLRQEEEIFPFSRTCMSASGFYLGGKTTNLNLVSVAQQPNSGPGGLSAKVSRPQQIHAAGRTPLNELISPLQRPLPRHHTTNTRYEHPRIQQDSNPQSSGLGFRPTHYIARPPGSVTCILCSG